MPTHCPFCHIVRKEARATVVYQDDLVTAFRDINPQAPVHILIVPNEHLESVNEITESHGEILGRMFTVAKEVAQREGIASRGYRLVVNTGPQAGQSVFHFHLHLLGGRRMAWPPG